MESTENLNQLGETRQHKGNFLSSNILQNPYLGLLLLVTLALIYLFHMMAQICIKKRRNVQIPRCKASENLQAKKKRSAEKQREVSFRDQLINELKLQFQQKKEHKISQETIVKSQLTLYEAYSLARDIKMSTKVEVNNTKKQEEKKRQEFQKMQQQKRKEQELNKQAQRSRKLSQKPRHANDSFVSAVPATRIKAATTQEQKDILSRQIDIKQKSQAPSLFGVNNQKGNSLFAQKPTENNQFPSKKDEHVKKEEKPIINAPFTGFGPVPAQQHKINLSSQKPIPSLFNIPPPNEGGKPTQTPPKPIQKVNSAQPQPSTSSATAPAVPPLGPSAPSVPPVLSASPAPSAHRGPPADKLSAFEFLQVYERFVDNMGEVVPINSKIEDLLGARSLASQILTEAKTQINSIDKSDEKQLNSFAQALYHNIIFQFINKSNVKSNLERIPPKSRTDQCQKNSINKYALTVNIYRLMGPCKRVWMIVFGKLLKLLDFLYKRKTDLESYHKLQLIQNGYIKKYKEVHSKYLSRLDFLIYMLFALTSFDPILVFRQIEEKQKDAEKTRMEIESWGNTWSYAEFWALCGVIFGNKHESYSKPIVYINLLYTLYPRIYENKRNPTLFVQQRELFIITLQKSKKYLQGFKMLKEVKILSECQQNQQLNFEYDGYDFVKSIKVLDNRIPEKGTEFKLNARDYEAKANIFYYFTKEK